MRDKPKFDRGVSHRGDGFEPPCNGPRRWKFPSWLVDDEFDRQMSEQKEPPIERWPGWLRVVVVVGGSAALWWVILASVSAALSGPK